MNKILLFRLLVLLPLAILGCASPIGPLFTQMTYIPKPDDRARVYTYKAKAWGRDRYLLEINDKPVTTLQRGGYYLYVTPPGILHLKAKTMPRFGNFIGALVGENSTTVIDAEAGKTYYVKMQGGIRIGLELVSQEVALEELPECRLLAPYEER